MSTGTPPSFSNARPTRRSAPKSRVLPISIDFADLPASPTPCAAAAPEIRARSICCSIPDGKPVTGNLNACRSRIASEDGWIEFPYTAKSGSIFESHTARAFLAELPGDYGLIVGRDVEEMRQFASLIRTTLVGALLITLILGLGGGLLLSRNFPPPRRCHHRRQPIHHDRRPERPHAGPWHRR